MVDYPRFSQLSKEEVGKKLADEVAAEEVAAAGSPTRRTTNEPEVELVQARVKGGVREIERISPIITGQKSEDRKNVSIERWTLAKGVLPLTLSRSLVPGEYRVAEILPEEGMDLGV